MPLFYFDFDGRTDEDGIPFDDLSAAEAQLTAVLPEIARDAFSEEHKGAKTWVCILRDDVGKELRRATLTMAVEDLSTRTSYSFERYMLSRRKKGIA